MGSGPARTNEKRRASERAARGARPALREWAEEAWRALAHLDAERLEKLVASCNVLSLDLASAGAEERAALCCEAREAAGDMATFSRVLEATRANLAVMNRLRELRGERLEYGAEPARGWVGTEAGHGDH